MPTKLPDAVLRQSEEADALAATAAGTPAPEDTATPPAPEPVPAEQAAPGEDWHHKFLTLQGKYNAEVPRLQAQVRQLTEELQAARAAPPPPTSEPATREPPQKLISDKDVETFGEDLVDLIRRAAREEAGPERTKLEQEIAALKAQIPDLQKTVDATAETQSETNRVSYFKELAALVPDYETINADEAFLGWLSMNDPLSGLIRDVLLKSAFDKFDAQRTAAMFNAYKQEKGTAPPTPDPAPEPPAPRSELEREVSPGTTRSSTEGSAAEPKTWTAAELAEFYNAVTRGDYRANPEEATRIEREIDKALAEGRVH